jgi:hypothetical protein
MVSHFWLKLNQNLPIMALWREEKRLSSQRAYEQSL